MQRLEQRSVGWAWPRGVGDGVGGAGEDAAVGRKRSTGEQRRPLTAGHGDDLLREWPGHVVVRTTETTTRSRTKDGHDGIEDNDSVSAASETLLCSSGRNLVWYLLRRLDEHELEQSCRSEQRRVRILQFMHGITPPYVVCAIASNFLVL
nr:hypothetical protein CFP56_44457 [Quercus suber]